MSHKIKIKLIKYVAKRKITRKMRRESETIAPILERKDVKQFQRNCFRINNASAHKHLRCSRFFVLCLNLK